jgi:hypothetical protein
MNFINQRIFVNGNFFAHCITVNELIEATEAAFERAIQLGLDPDEVVTFSA